VTADRLATPWARAVAAAALRCVVVVGSAVLWIGLPVLGLWVAGELTHSPRGFLFATLLGIPLSMVVFGFLLYRVNAVYERLAGGAEPPRRGRAAWLVASSDERGELRRARSPRPLIEIAMTLSATAALILMAVWFFLLADSPLAPLP